MATRHGRARLAGLCALLLLGGDAVAEYCLDWSSVVQKYSGSQGHCWPSEQACTSYRLSRPTGDYRGGCYYRPGQYPPTGGAHAGPSAADQAAAQAAQAQKDIAARKAAAEREEQAAFQRGKDALLHGGIKGVAPAGGGITLKLPPAGTARTQLDCATRQSTDNRGGDEAHRGDLQRPAADCAQPLPDVPVPSAPVPVAESSGLPTDPAALAALLSQLVARVGESRQVLATREQEVAAREQDVQREERAQLSLKGDAARPAAESDALRKAREALARAKAARERTAQELQALERQEAAARGGTPP